MLFRSVSGQLSGVSVVQGLIVQEVSILVEPHPKQLLLPLGQRDHYLLGDNHFLKRTPTFPSTLLFLSTLFSLHYKSSFWKLILVWFSGVLV